MLQIAVMCIGVAVSQSYVMNGNPLNVASVFTIALSRCIIMSRIPHGYAFCTVRVIIFSSGVGQSFDLLKKHCNFVSSDSFVWCRPPRESMCRVYRGPLKLLAYLQPLFRTGNKQRNLKLQVA